MAPRRLRIALEDIGEATGEDVHGTPVGDARIGHEDERVGGGAKHLIH